LLVSMDPAHNQRDIFERAFNETPRRVTPFLTVKEVDADYWIRKYLKETQATIKKTYHYESAFNLESYFNVLQFSPGLEEYALLLAFESVIESCRENSRIILDMAPTALSLRFFSLPSTTLIWLEELLKLRNKIIDKKEIISKIKFGKKEIETDKVKNRLDALVERYRYFADLFCSPETRIHLVLNEDRMSLTEALRIKEKLLEINMHVHTVVVNKSADHGVPGDICDAFKNECIVALPLAPKSLIGQNEIQDYIAANIHLLDN